MASRVVPVDPAPAPATPVAPDLPITSSVTPAKPIPRPSMREPPGRSLSQSQATTAPSSGTVAFRMDVRPVVMCITAKANSANGMPELSRPTKRMGLARRTKSLQTPGTRKAGSRNSEASATRRPAVGKAPNSAAPRRMKRKDEPQRAASRMNSRTRAGDMVSVCRQRLCGGIAG